MKSIILGVLSFAPISLVLVLVFFLFNAQVETINIFGPIYGAFSLLSFVVFLIHVSINTRVPKEKRGLWIVVIIFGNGLVYPFYWWWYIRDAT